MPVLFFPPSFAQGLPGLRGPLVGGLRELPSRPFDWFLWGHIPQAPWHGGFAPLHPPVFPTLVCSGFAGVKGPPRGQVAGVAFSPLDLFFWGHIPQAPCQGASPPGPPIFGGHLHAHGMGLRPLHPRFSPPGMGASPPCTSLWGHTPQAPEGR